MNIGIEASWRRGAVAAAGVADVRIEDQKTVAIPRGIVVAGLRWV